MANREFKFGRANVKVIYTLDSYKGTRRYHEAKIEVDQLLLDSHLRHEIIDLVAYSLGIDPITNLPHNRFVKQLDKKGEKYVYELRWITIME